MTYTIGIDVGGTFTDIVVSCPDGRDHHREGRHDATRSVGRRAGWHCPGRAKRWASTPRVCSSATSRIVHGTTVATNALLEGKAARVGMLTTEGHRDVIEMREGLKPDRYNLRMAPPEPLVPRRLRLPVRERIRADGSMETRWTRRRWTSRWHSLPPKGVQAVAVCFLHAWRNPAHEQAAAAAVAGAVAAGLCDRFGRRAAADQGVRALLHHRRQRRGRAGDRELSAAGCRSRLGEAGYFGELLVILSHGGVASVAEAIRLAAGTALSGPAGGVAAAVALARAGVARDLIAFDMGGTSTDIALVRGGRADPVGRQAVANARIALPATATSSRSAPAAGRSAQLDRGGTAGSGAGQRRGRSGTGLLRPGRYRGDGDRCQSGAGLSRSGELPGRPADAGRGSGDRCRRGVSPMGCGSRCPRPRPASIAW